jgi:hypothetical protein
MAEDLRRRLREGGRAELASLFDQHLPSLSPEEASLALANPHLDAELIERLAATPTLVASYEVRRGVALDRRTPEILARRLMVGLYWRDLVSAGRDARLRSTVRRAADLLLANRLPGLALGERLAIARSAGPGLISRFRDETQPRVVQALLENPRLTEGALLPMLHRERVPPAVLDAVARHRSWGVRYPVRLALARNPSTPVPIALAVLPHLKKADLSGVARDLRVPSPVRRRAGLLAGVGSGPRGI